MTRGALCGFIAIILSSAVSADTYYVDPLGGGSDDSLGTAAKPWETIAHFNALPPGPADTCVIVSTDTTSASFDTEFEIAPEGNGSPVSPIVYIGDADLPGAIAVHRIRLGYFDTGAEYAYPFGSYVIVKGVRSKTEAVIGREWATANVYGAVIDSCLITQRVAFYGAWDSKLSNSRAETVALLCSGGATEGPGVGACYRDTVADNRVVDGIIAHRSLQVACMAQECVIEGNTVTGTLGGTDGIRALEVTGGVTGCTFNGNSFAIRDTAALVNAAVYAISDSAHGNTWTDDVLHYQGLREVDLVLGDATCSGNVFENVTWRLSGSATWTAMQGATLSGSIRSRFAEPIVATSTEASTIEHLTAFGTGPLALGSTATGSTVRYNVMLAPSTDGVCANRQTTFEVGTAGGYTEDENMHFIYSGADSLSMARRIATVCSAVAGLSVFGDPLLADTSFAGWDPTPTAGSVAADPDAWSAAALGYVGAEELDEVAPDSALFISGSRTAAGNSATVTVLVGGDDGGSGTAASVTFFGRSTGLADCDPYPDYEADYDALNYEDLQIDSAPGAAGSYVTRTLTFPAPTGDYCYVVVRTVDEAGNESWSRLCLAKGESF